MAWSFEIHLECDAGRNWLWTSWNSISWRPHQALRVLCCFFSCHHLVIGVSVFLRSRWVPTSTFRRSIAGNSRRWCVFWSVSAPGSTVSSTPSTECPDPLARRRLAVWATRQSKVRFSMLFQSFLRSFFLKWEIRYAGFVVYRVRVRRGTRKRQAHKGQVYGKPSNQGINQLKWQRNLQSKAEVGGILRFIRWTWDLLKKYS